VLALAFGLDPADHLTAFAGLVALQAAIGLIAGIEGARRARRARAGRAAAATFGRRAAAEEAERARARLLAGTMHEIGVPLRGIIALMERVMEVPNLSGAARQDTGRALAAARDLTQVFADMFEMPDGAQAPLASAPFRLDEVMEDVAALLGGRAAATGVRLSTAMAPGTPAAWRGDAARVRQIIVNLVIAALRLTERGDIRVEARMRAAGGLQLRVSDTGRSIPPERRERLFEPFAWPEGGLGLSLSICRDLAARMGGSVAMQPDAEGNAFTVSLPLPLADPLAVGAGAAAEAPSPAVAAPVLVVDDVAANRLLLGAVLSRAGFTHEQAADGETALALLASRSYAAVLMDVQMPGIDGLEATRRLRAMPAPTGRLPVIGVTAYRTPENDAAAIQAGMNLCLAKPVSAADLAEILGRTTRVPAPS